MTHALLLWSPLVLSCSYGTGLLWRPTTRELVHQSSTSNGLRSPTVGVGRVLCQLIGRPSTPAVHRRVGRVVVVGPGLLLLAPLLALVAGTVWYGASVLRRRGRARAATEQMLQGLGEVVDLFAMALTSGHTIAASLQQAAVWSPEPFAREFTHCLDEIRVGRALSDSLEAVPSRLGPSCRPLIAALVAHDRYGAPIVQNLAQLAADARSDHRRRAEAAARRLPVTLLFPLVVCVLPAFLLLTVVPVLAETLSAFDLSASP